MSLSNHSYSSLGLSTPKPSAAEVEDGEVDDTKNGSATIPPGPVVRESTPPIPAPAAAVAIEPKTSDVLASRAQFLRERDEKNASLAPTPPNVPGRPESSRNPSSLLPERGNHSLPNRPDAPFPSRNLLDRVPSSSSRHGDRRDPRDGRDSRMPDTLRDRAGERSRDFGGSDRREAEALRDYGRSSDRGLDRPRTRPDPPPRWTPDSARENQERVLNGNRNSDSSGRLSRETMLPPRLASSSLDRGSAVNPERLPPVNPERQEILNPERAALITGSQTPPRGSSPRRHRDDHRDSRHPRDRTSSRPQSPRRHGADMDQAESRRDERSSRLGTQDLHGRLDNSQPPPPVGPRSDRPQDRNNDRNSTEWPREVNAFPTTPSTRSIDLDHGRLNTGPRSQIDPNFGRLNPAPATDIPLGPRDRNQRPNRASGSSQQHHDSRLNEPTRPPTPEKNMVPTGPSSDRQPRRSASGAFDQVPSTPTTPLSAVTAPPIHPDRLKHLGPAALPPPPPPTVSSTPSGIHPSRMRSFDNDLNVNNPPSQNDRRPPMPPILTAGPPSGPKGSLSSPISSGANGLTAPTGPASATERTRGGRRQLAGINTMLQQAGQQNGSERMNVRGRGRMSSQAQAETPLSQPPTPIAPPPPPPPPGLPPGGAAPNRDLAIPERADLMISGNGDDRERDRNSRNGRHSGRHSRKTSRSPNRESKRGQPEDERGNREHRGSRHEHDRTENSGRGDHHGRESRRDLMAPRDPGGSTRDTGRDRDRERDNRRDGRDREGGRGDIPDQGWQGSDRGTRGGDRGGRSRDMRGDDRHDSRTPRGEDGGRKRRSDEGGMDRGPDKRPRR